VSLGDKVAVVTGATGALGRVLTKTLLEKDAYVAATYRTIESTEEFKALIGERIARLMLVQADVTDETSVQALMKQVLEKLGRIDFLLNIVGAYVGGAEVSDTSVSDWNFMMDVNLKSVFLCSKTVLPHMIRQNYGKIVSISARSAVEKRFRIKNGPYAVSKAGVLVLTEIIADEVKKYGINVNCILPSTIDTAANRRNMPEADFSKWVKPEEIVKVVLFLLSEDSKATSGAGIPVYGKT
jgi:NAD(P)-dependent dehydrogenase (short-subunit alcohol dehydrogenase family)